MIAAPESGVEPPSRGGGNGFDGLYAGLGVTEIVVQDRRTIEVTLGKRPEPDASDR